MMLPQTDLPVQDVCHNAFRLMRDHQYDDANHLLVSAMAKTDDSVATALYHSALGVLEKMRGDYKAALRHYQRAERLLPDDPAIKLITARLFIEVFKEYDQALKRCRAVEKLVPHHAVMLHHARTLEGLAWGAQGNRRKAVACLSASLINDFSDFGTSRNIDFHLVEWCVKKQWNLEVCREFLTRASAFASACNETTWNLTLGKILEAMRPSYPSPFGERAG